GEQFPQRCSTDGLDALNELRRVEVAKKSAEGSGSALLFFGKVLNGDIAKLDVDAIHEADVQLSLKGFPVLGIPSRVRVLERCEVLLDFRRDSHASSLLELFEQLAKVMFESHEIARSKLFISADLCFEH